MQTKLMIGALIVLVGTLAMSVAAGPSSDDLSASAELNQFFKKRGADQTGVVDMMNANMNNPNWMKIARQKCVTACRFKEATKEGHFSAGAQGMDLQPMGKNLWVCGCVDKPIYPDKPDRR